MIKLERTSVDGWEAAVRGMRNPLNSWEKIDSGWYFDGSEMKYRIGENDLTLMQKLYNAGSDHRKYLRFIDVTVDVTAPLYWVAEHDTYKVGTVRNSCSFMHKGVSKAFEIRDFSVSDNRIYDVLSPLPVKKYDLEYPYDTDEYKTYTTTNGRKYKVFRNGRVVRCEFDYVDSWGTGRLRHFEEKEVKPSANANGYYEINIGGRAGEKWLLHRLVAKVWLNNSSGFETVNHIDGNKGNNSVENLEWISREENIKKGFDEGYYENLKSLHCRYIKWKNGSDGIPKDIYHNDNYELFSLCNVWEKNIDILNALRQEYLDTKDESVFQMIRQLLPQGYNVKYTWHGNYEVLVNQYFARKNHRLPEWHTYCDWIKTLPYFCEICGVESEDSNV